VDAVNIVSLMTRPHELDLDEAAALSPKLAANMARSLLSVSGFACPCLLIAFHPLGSPTLEVTL